ncbi:BrnT family toxin [uncultured Ruegeria sp.]|uniref:BrnT family toxin n=1 Tax=uncultured Ruegeria sp. TaxID=259304 RepID=UPI00260CFA01|nr:BrnT family toxin [uncultured Ruegeria sp.]
MNYEWDSAKNTTNQEKHGLSFDAMDRFDWTFALCVETQVVDHEERELWIARLT